MSDFDYLDYDIGEDFSKKKKKNKKKKKKKGKKKRNSLELTLDKSDDKQASLDDDDRSTLLSTLPNFFHFSRNIALQTEIYSRNQYNNDQNLSICTDYVGSIPVPRNTVGFGSKNVILLLSPVYATATTIITIITYSLNFSDMDMDTMTTRTSRS